MFALYFHIKLCGITFTICSYCHSSNISEVQTELPNIICKVCVVLLLPCLDHFSPVTADDSQPTLWEILLHGLFEVVHKALRYQKTCQSQSTARTYFPSNPLHSSKYKMSNLTCVTVIKLLQYEDITCFICT